MNLYEQDELVEKVLEMIGGEYVKPDLQSWRDLAALSVGITQDSPRYRPMLDALTACDEAYKRKDWGVFWRAAEQAKVLIRSSSKVEGL